VPFYSKNKEGITSVVERERERERERGRDKIKSTGNGKVPKTVNGKTVVSQWLRAEVVIPL
jgi:hypothetical protein